MGKAETSSNLDFNLFIFAFNKSPGPFDSDKGVFPGSAADLQVGEAALPKSWLGPVPILRPVDSAPPAG